MASRGCDAATPGIIRYVRPPPRQRATPDSGVLSEVPLWEQHKEALTRNLTTLAQAHESLWDELKTTKDKLDRTTAELHRVQEKSRHSCQQLLGRDREIHELRMKADSPAAFPPDFLRCHLLAIAEAKSQKEKARNVEELYNRRLKAHRDMYKHEFQARHNKNKFEFQFQLENHKDELQAQNDKHAETAWQMETTNSYLVKTTEGHLGKIYDLIMRRRPWRTSSKHMKSKMLRVTRFWMINLTRVLSRRRNQ